MNSINDFDRSRIYKQQNTNNITGTNSAQATETSTEDITQQSVTDNNENTSVKTFDYEELKRFSQKRVLMNSNDEYIKENGTLEIYYGKFKELCEKYNFDTHHLSISDNAINATSGNTTVNVYNLLVLAYGKENVAKVATKYDESNIEELFKAIAGANLASGSSSDSSSLVSEPKPKITMESQEYLDDMQKAADKLNLTPSTMQGVYYQFNSNGSYLYIWDPTINRFKSFPTNVRNDNGSINQEFTQAGKAINRTEKNIYYEALLEAYKNGYNFTNKSPWVCEKDGIFYEYDKDNGIFKKSEKYN